ncbi:hypothetical protein CEXT_332961 [Caerostris extrusa]|uniref:Uncharacterized protein n=1 Tax=Caerostris extrusa TaxID=172846 RepID=A0AAV4S2I7_CAEEX|nr:hypothetical protein CEXT_332961 [Caerostris extrusa]
MRGPGLSRLVWLDHAKNKCFPCLKYENAIDEQIAEIELPSNGKSLHLNRLYLLSRQRERERGRSKIYGLLVFRCRRFNSRPGVAVTFNSGHFLFLKGLLAPNYKPLP